jgi:23S rRNA (uracil1939-C5)-methyltransferase
VTQEQFVTHLAARGDGVTSGGQYVAGAVPGDSLCADGSLRLGPHHTEPLCRHYGACGGCQLQHCDDEVLADFVTGRIVSAAAGKGLHAVRVAPAHLSPPGSRRRATLRAINGGGQPLIGFREEASHKLVGIKECPVLDPRLFAVIAPLRAMLARRSGRYAVDVEMTLADQGVDLGLKGLSVEGLEQTEALLDLARDHGLARITIDQGYGAEAIWEPEPVTISLSGVSVSLPVGSFLQATADGEAALTRAAKEWLTGASAIADLFSGLGTFAFALAGPAKVLAVEAAANAHFACQSAARQQGKPVHAMHRDLFRNPLQPDELNRFSAILIDPPRAGAKEQVAQLAASAVETVVYVSCNPATWARDAQVLAEAGYRLEELRPVGQFRWSTHVELASLFRR